MSAIFYSALLEMLLQMTILAEDAEKEAAARRAEGDGERALDAAGAALQWREVADRLMRRLTATRPRHVVEHDLRQLFKRAN